MRARLEVARAAGAEFRVPMVVVAETVWGNGPRDAPVNLVLAQTSPQHPLTEGLARTAGELLGDAKSSATIDALVVAEAIHCAPAIILTSDPTDLSALLGRHRGVIVEAI
ncbi:MAG: hypothetical protein ABI894_16740 [Ilumatobacteraceae bacterium]